jgi:hypothetical protein
VWSRPTQRVSRREKNGVGNLPRINIEVSDIEYELLSVLTQDGLRLQR